MKNHCSSICILVCIILTHSNASIWIKNVKHYGPAATAVGVKCLATMTKFYLKDPTLTRAGNLVVAFSRNLTIPADNVQRYYLRWIHAAITSGEVKS